MANLPKDYLELISLWEKSGTSRAKFCRENGISYHVFMGHLRRQKSSTVVGFEQVCTVESSVLSDVGVIEIHFLNGVKALFPGNFPLDKLRGFLRC